MKKIKDISVITSTYKNRDGQEKKRYLTIGSLFEDGEYLKVKLDFTPLIKGGWDGWANCYDVEEKTNKQEDRDDGQIPF